MDEVEDLKRIILIINIFILSCSQQKVVDVETSNVGPESDIEVEGEGNSEIGPGDNDRKINPSSQDGTWEQDCEDLDSHIWNETNKTCHPEYQTISEKDVCNGVPGYSWSEIDGTCFPEYTSITSKEECESKESYIWSVLNEACHPEFSNITSDVECNSITGYSWSDANNSCYPEYSSITSEVQCNSISGYSWSVANNACYPEYSSITSGVQCNSISGYSWSVENKACYPDFSSITSEEACIVIPGYSWKASDNTCVEDYVTLTAEESCNSLSHYLWDQNQCVPRGGITQNQAAKSCKDIIDNNFSVGDGVYWIDPNLGDTEDAYRVYCDMTIDGGGWLLVLNYLHSGASNPNLSIKTSAPPLLGSNVLGTDESVTTEYWGHTGKSLFSKLQQGATETRFFCKTASHNRIMHFKTSLDAVFSYFSTGTGSLTGIATNHTLLSDHSANLPGQTASYYTNQGDEAMTNFPFWKGGIYHWGIKGTGSRWECDDMGGSYDTIHRIYIR